MFENPKVLGIVLDISLRHIKENRLLDIVKKQLIDFVQVYDNGENLLYLYNPNLVEALTNRGMFISAIGNYETDGVQFNLTDPLKQTLFIIASHQGDKKLVLITDRIQSNNFYSLSKIEMINKNQNFDIDFEIIGIGDGFDPDLKWTKKILDPSVLSQTLQEIV